MKRLAFLFFQLLSLSMLSAQAPVVTSVRGLLKTGEDGVVRCTVDGTNMTMTLRFGKGNQPLDHGIDTSMVFQSFSTWDGVIPGNYITHEGVWVQVRAENSFGSVIYPSETRHTFVSVLMDSADIAVIRQGGRYNSGLPTHVYTLVSLPVDGRIELDRVLGWREDGVIGPTRWRLLSYRDSYYDEEDLKGGEAYFIRNDTDVDPLRALQNGIFVGGSIPDLIRLEPYQWNLIGWPQTTSRTVTLDHQKVGALWELKDGSWVRVNMFKPFGAYAIYNKTAFPLTLNDVLLSSVPKKTTEWRMRIGIESGNLRDMENEAGVCSAERVFVNNEPEPIGPDDALRLYFSKNGVLFSSLFNCADSNATWPFFVEARTGKREATLHFDAAELPSEYEVYVVDVENNRILRKTEIDQYRFRPIGRHRFVMIAGKTDFVEKAIDELTAGVPEDVRLYPAYPNPFNPVTTIAFDLNRSQYVRLQIFNAVGQRVRTIADEFMNAGRQSRVWDGRDDRGQQVGSGVYFYRLTAGNRIQTKKLLYIK